MTRPLDLGDIQGNVIRAYGRFSFPFARYFFLHVEEGKAAQARDFLQAILPRVTTGTRWPDGKSPSPVTLNIGFTWFGLYNLGVPYRTLQGMPEEYIAGMKQRAFILGDAPADGRTLTSNDWCDHWDDIWKNNRVNDLDIENFVHIWISMNAKQAYVDGKATDQPDPALDEQTAWLKQTIVDTGNGVRLMGGHGKGPHADEFQAASAVFVDTPDGHRVPTPKEHFGFTDGIGDPVFAGQYPPEKEKTAVIGRGKWMEPLKGWEPLATGEFVLGYDDEAQELPPMARPWAFAQNGSFMAYRKLHQNVASFREVVAGETKRYAKVQNVPEDEAAETLMAKMIGRWSDGVPLSKVPTYAEWRAFQKAKGFDAASFQKNPAAAGAAYYAYLKSTEPSDFKYGDDMHGIKCPVGSHLRRVNTRDHLDPHNSFAAGAENPDGKTMLNKRRRMLRRGLPYGSTGLGEGDDTTEQGVIFMAVCASLFRQFEFVQQQWIQYGLDFDSGNNTCPLLGAHERFRRHVIPADPMGDRQPYIMDSLKTFVETRGGDYFFIPSITSLRMIATGTVDPT